MTDCDAIVFRYGIRLALGSDRSLDRTSICIVLSRSDRGLVYPEDELGGRGGGGQAEEYHGLDSSDHLHTLSESTMAI